MQRASLLWSAILAALSACTTPEEGPKETTPPASEDSGSALPDLCTRHADSDGDGFGASAPIDVPCDTSGYVDDASDCDDTDATVFPGAPERCNEVDDDCDTTIDEDLVFEWYADADNDGYGSGDSIDDCDPPDGFVDNADDCQDTHPAVHPGATEVCNTLDDDCNGLTDDEDPDVDLSTASTWYADADNDGFGVPHVTHQSCANPASGYVDNFDDCDDIDPAVNPDATEVCDGVDNDCNELADDADPSLDRTTASSWFADSDGDSYGDPDAEVLACVVPSEHVSDDTDCDDTSADIHPGATEVCNALDDDCDLAIDDADADVDLSTGLTTYADTDGDGYGDADSGLQECAASSGRTTDNTDCNDSNASTHPGATEVCDSADNDCDGLTDDDDTDLDLSTADTWYRDADGDGLGDASSTTLACALPSGYSADATDCDDTGFSDYDGDLLQDCEDSDADGDGLSNTYDADDFDDALVRGPTGGFGNDGALSHTGSTWSAASDHTLLATSAAEDDTSLEVADPTHFAVGDEVLVWVAQGADAGTHSFHFVTASGTTSIDVEPPLAADLDASDVVLVQRVPHYSAVTVSSTLTPDLWDGASGGAVVFRSTGPVSISGSIDVSGAGYLGGQGTMGHSRPATTGGSYENPPASASSNALRNDGGGGAHSGSSTAIISGAGGGYGTSGDAAQTALQTYTFSSGQSYGSSTLDDWFFGSGGGGGSPDIGSDGYFSGNRSGAGGAGGGLVAIYSADTITVSGDVWADGAAGDDAYTTGTTVTQYGELGGGGGGAGGQVLLVADTITITGSVEALGGEGGDGWSDVLTPRPGGDGGEGRIRLEYTTISGGSLVDPTPSTGAYVE